MLVDWESTIAAAPAYDVVAAVRSMAWRPHRFASGVPDRRTLLRDALLDGYRERGRRGVVDRVRASGAVCELRWTVRWMAHMEEWVSDPDRPLDAVAAELRSDVVALL